MSDNRKIPWGVAAAYSALGTAMVFTTYLIDEKTIKNGWIELAVPVAGAVIGAGIEKARSYCSNDTSIFTAAYGVLTGGFMSCATAWGNTPAAVASALTAGGATMTAVYTAFWARKKCKQQTTEINPESESEQLLRNPPKQSCCPC